MTEKKLSIGLVLNPVAGVGGPAALKGSDGVVEEAARRGSTSKVAERVTACINAVSKESIAWFAAPGKMGSDVLTALKIPHQVVGELQTGETSAGDTRAIVSELSRVGIDILLFAGGDGTARDIVDVFERIPAVIGIPCGVKMHSGVFTTTPHAAADLINKLLAGEILSVIEAEVRDIDEASFREGVVKTRHYGELPVPDDLRYMQQTKVGGREVDELVVQEIAADFIENLDPDVMYIMGSGSTVATVMEAMGLESTLLGIDVVRGGEVIGADVSEQKLKALLSGEPPAKIVVTAIGGQGHILGRGNQQLSPTVIRKVGSGNIVILATKSKLSGLNQRPLLVDTGDEALDQELSGMKSVITGYEDRVLYRLGVS